MKKIGLYPGTFDPPTNGHVDIATRAARIFDTLIIAVSDNPAKNPLFSIEERLELLKQTFADLKNVQIKSFSRLLADFAADEGAMALVRGLRAVSDFEYELQLASFNSHLMEKLDTVFFMAKDENLFVSSSVIKEIAQYGGDVSRKVPACVWNKLKEKFKV